MKSRATIVAELASRKYHNYMSGAMFPSCGVDVEFVAWMLDTDAEALGKEIDEEAEAIRLAAARDYEAKYGSK